MAPVIGYQVPIAIQSTALAVLKLPPTMIVAPVVVLLCTFKAPLSPDQLEPDVYYNIQLENES